MVFADPGSYSGHTSSHVLCLLVAEHALVL